MNAASLAYLQSKYAKRTIPDISSGDTVRVHQKIKEGNKERVQVFEGLVIATKHGKGLDGSFTVRKISAASVGVERTFPVHSPNITKVERTKTAKVSRAKLYYMRDRQGKAARFKQEVQNKMVWSESELPTEEVVQTPEIAMTEELVSETPVHMEQLDTDATNAPAEADTEDSEQELPVTEKEA
jgi:large subunit ribosomal protein L19